MAMSLKEAYAYIRYLDESNHKCIVKTSTIKGFDAANFDTRVRYKVYWEPTPGEDTNIKAGYYDAQILIVKDTLEALQERINSGRRIQIPKLINDSMESEPASRELQRDNKRTAASTKEFNKEKKAKVDSATQKSYTSIMQQLEQKKQEKPVEVIAKNVDDASSGEDTSKTFAENKVLHSRVDRLESDNANLRHLVEDLSKALAAKVLQLDNYTGCKVNENSVVSNPAVSTAPHRHWDQSDYNQSQDVVPAIAAGSCSQQCEFLKSDMLSPAIVPALRGLPFEQDHYSYLDLDVGFCTPAEHNSESNNGTISSQQFPGTNHSMPLDQNGTPALKPAMECYQLPDQVSALQLPTVTTQPLQNNQDAGSSAKQDSKHRSHSKQNNKRSVAVETALAFTMRPLATDHTY